MGCGMSKIRKAEGSGYESHGRFYMRVTIAPGKRPPVRLPWCQDLEAAKARGRAVQALVNLLRRAGEDSWIPRTLTGRRDLPPRGRANRKGDGRDPATRPASRASLAAST